MVEGPPDHPSVDWEEAPGETPKPPQPTDIVLVAIEALTAEDTRDRQMGSDVLEMAMGDPTSWFMDVPKIMRCIHQNVERVSTEPARRSLDSLLLLLTKRWPREVVRSLLEVSPTCDSAALAVWDVMVSTRCALGNVLRELLNVLQDRGVRRVAGCAAGDACICLLDLLLRADVGTQEFTALYGAQRCLRHLKDPAMLWLVLGGLITLSETLETAQKMPVLLPDIMGILQETNSDIKMKVLTLFQNVMPHVDTQEDAPMVLQLAETLRPLFDDESSGVRELSINLFEAVTKTAVRRNKEKMKEKLQRVLLPLSIHLHDQNKSVAKAAGDALVTCAESLGWRRLGQLVKTGQVYRIGDCLLQQDRSRLEDYLNQSLPYLKDAQASLREAAVRFLGLVVQHLRNHRNRQQNLWDIFGALQPLKKDPEPSVGCLAKQTLFILMREYPRAQRRELPCCPPGAPWGH